MALPKRSLLNKKGNLAAVKFCSCYKERNLYEQGEIKTHITSYVCVQSALQKTVCLKTIYCAAQEPGKGTLAVFFGVRIGIYIFSAKIQQGAVVAALRCLIKLYKAGFYISTSWPNTAKKEQPE